MDSVTDHIILNLFWLDLKAWDNNDYSPIINDDSMADFRESIQYLSFFVGCIRNWIISDSDSDGDGDGDGDAFVPAPKLIYLATKIEAAVETIGHQFIKQVRRHKLTSVLNAVSFKLLGSYDERAWRWICIFEKWKAMIDDLKPEIAEACGSFLISNSKSVEYVSPFLGFNICRSFVHSKNLIFFVFSDCNSLCRARRHGRTGIKFGKGDLDVILEFLEFDDLMNPKIKAFLVKVGSLIVSAEMLSCQWWAKHFDPKMEKYVYAAFMDVKQNVVLANPDFLDIIFGELNGPGKSFSIARIIVSRLIPYWVKSEEFLGRDFNVFDELDTELFVLLTTVLNMPEEDALLQIFLPDIKQLVMEIASHHHSLFHVKDRNVIMDLVAKVCLIKVEILLRAIVNGAHIIFGLKEPVDFLNQMVSIMEVVILLAKAEGNEVIKFANQILMLLKEVVIDVKKFKISVASLFLKLDNVYLKDTWRRLLLKTLFLKGELLFLKLHDKLLPSFNDSTKALHEGFKIMIPLVIKDEKLKFADVEVVATRIISLYHRMLKQDISEEIFQSINKSVSDVGDDLNCVMNQFKEIYLGEIYLRVQKSDFPKTNAAGFLDSLMRKLHDLLSYGMGLVKSVITREQIAEIMGYFEFFQTFLEDTSTEDDNLGARVINICYEAEYLIDSSMHGKEDEWHSIIWLYSFLQEIREIKIQVSSNQAVMRNESVKNPIISRKTTPNIDEALVNLVDQEEIVIDKLIGGFKKLLTVSIVGMPGIGKTTLAKKVFNSPEVVSRFTIRAWCCASEIYRKRDVLLQILSHVIALNEKDIKGMTNEDLEFQLNKILMTQKYVIVLDDVWDTDVLDDLVRRFPDNENGSRILITSRPNDVALMANPNADHHHLRLLSDNESWELLQKKIFGKKQCPEDIKEIGKKIAASCKGLPLAVIATAGLLERIEMQHDQWNDIAQSLISQILDDPQDQCRYILELSYKNLPDCLKACYLYFGAFLEDQDIPVRKLLQLWIAEGYVQDTKFKTMEDVAEDYLMDLIGRSLVILSKERSRAGGAKACRIHDVLRKLCQSKAKEDKFMKVITMSDASDSANLHVLDYVLSANFGNPSSSVVTYEDHRLCFCAKPKHFMDSRPSGPSVRSLLCFDTGEEDPRYPFDTSFIYQNFRYLKVLDLECIDIGKSFAEDLLLLLQLRYLAVSGYIDSVPESIAKLWNLETLILKGLRRGKVKLPHTIFRLKKLRHVCVNDFAALSFQENSCRLDNLVTISSLILPFGKETDNTLMQFPNLKKLKCIFSESHWFPDLKVLNQLESLNVTYYGRDVGTHGEFCFSSNLKKLTLSNFRLPWNKIKAIGQLRNLEVLKLLSGAFVGKEWEMAEGEFVGLKYLKLENLDVSIWNANSDCLSKLRQLVLRSCKNLEIPVDFAESSSLQIIDVRWCGDRAEKSARQIRKDGDEILKVFINFVELEFSLS